MKKLLSLTLASIISLSMFTACDSSKEETTTSESTSTSTETTETTSNTSLTVAIWDKNQEAGMRALADDFTANTGVEVEIQVTPWDQYWTMLEAAATGGELPDVFWMHSNEFEKYAEYDMLLDLTDKIKGSTALEMDKFPQDIVNMYNYDNKQLAVPKDIDTIALWYNKALFDAAGISYPDETWTWDDFYKAAETLTDEENGVYGYASSISGGQETYYNTIYSMGGYVISDDKKTSGFDDPNTIKALSLFNDMIQNGYAPSVEVMADNKPDVLFGSGKAAMTTQGSWMLPGLASNEYIQENADIAVLPKYDTDDSRVTIYNGLSWAAAYNTDAPEEAWQFIEYLGTKEAQQKQSDLGVVMSAYEGTATNFVNAYENFNVQAYVDMLDNMVLYPRSKSTVVWEGAYKDILTQIFAGNISVEEGSAQMATAMNEILATE